MYGTKRTREAHVEERRLSRAPRIGPDFGSRGNDKTLSYIGWSPQAYLYYEPDMHLDPPPL